MEFKKVLSRFYRRWYDDCLGSIIYCEENNRPEDAQKYRDKADAYKKLISENTEAIEFFSQGDNAHLIDKALPEKFRGYK